MKTHTPIEPGILKIFRWYVGIRLALLALVALANRGEDPPDPQQFPATGLVLFGALFLMLMWPAIEKWMGRWFLPTAIVVATIAPIADTMANISGRLESGVTPNNSIEDYWLPFFLLFIPFIITAWQYRYRWVVVFAVFSTVIEVVGLSAVFADENVEQLEILVALVAARGFLFAFLGFFVSKLVARQRDLRAELESQAIVREQLAAGRERTRLARELHDTLAHTMTATAVQLEAAEALWDNDIMRAREHVGQALEGTRLGLDEARRAIEDLRASPLEDYGLLGALQWLARETAAKTGVTIVASIDEEPEDLGPDLEQAVYRIAEEAVANAVRHGQPNEVKLDLSLVDGQLTTTISDDGSGFDPNASHPGHHGIVGMRERAELVDGKLDIVSSTEGTRVTFTVPVA